MRHWNWILISLMAAACLSGCDTVATSTGEHNHPCFGDGTCLEGFFCEPTSKTCLLPEELCAGLECGPSPNVEIDCGTCTEATEYCSTAGKCEDDCVGRVCGQSPNEGFDCGTCSEATETCLFGQCEDLGYAWQNPPADNTMTLHAAIDYCEGLSLDGYSDWHLPSISELRSLIRGCPATETGGSCGVNDDCLSDAACRDSSCDGCSDGQGPAAGCYWPDGMEGSCSYYWSSSRGDLVDFAWYVDFDYGYVDSNYEGSNRSVRCVRRGE